MKHVFVILLLCLSPLSRAGLNECSVQVEGKYCVSINWIEGPYIDAYSINQVRVSDIESKELISLDGVEFRTWMIMDMHEHGGAKVLTTELDSGIYENDEIYFFSGMSGTWQFRLVYNGIEYVLYKKEI
jgi:hypothetical protein